MKKFVLAISLSFLSSCVTTLPPKNEYVLARAAIEAARLEDAPRLAQGLFSKAEYSYRKAEVFYGNREYMNARKEFNIARKTAEEAEAYARKKRDSSEVPE